jgi:hypothetical protein
MRGGIKMSRVVYEVPSLLSFSLALNRWNAGPSRKETLARRLLVFCNRSSFFIRKAGVMVFGEVDVAASASKL